MNKYVIEGLLRVRLLMVLIMNKLARTPKWLASVLEDSTVVSITIESKHDVRVVLVSPVLV